MSSTLANIFGASPVIPLEKHVDIAHRCASQLPGFFAAAIAGDWAEAEAIKQRIDALENEADELKKDIRLRLPKSLFMPVSRQDLLELLQVQDMIANRTRDVARKVLIRKAQIPAAVAQPFTELVERVVDATEQARESVRELDELFTAGFRGAEVELVSAMIEKLDAIETDTDEKQAALNAAIHAIEDTLDPVGAMFLYQTVSLTGEVADMAERVGRRLELLLSH